MRIVIVSIFLVVVSSSVFAAYEEVCTLSSNKVPMKPSTPTAEFDYSTENGKVLIDNRYNLMWMRCVAGESLHVTFKTCEGTATKGQWNDALSEVNTINGDSNKNFGFTDWRMPNVKELMSIVEHQCAYPAMNGYLFPGATGHAIWSNTPASDAAGLDTLVRYVNFFTGSMGTEEAGTGSFSIRLVRDYVAP